MPREESPAPGRSSLITSAPMSARIMVQNGPAMCSVMSSTFTPSSGPRGFFSVMSLPSPLWGEGRVRGVTPVSRNIARVAQHVGHRDLVEDGGERADHAPRGADTAREQLVARGLHRPDGCRAIRLELGEQCGDGHAFALGHLAVVVGVVAALHR